MKADLSDLSAFVAVAQAKGFREGARASGISASGLSEAGQRLLDRPAGTLKLYVPVSAARLVPAALRAFIDFIKRS